MRTPQELRTTDDRGTVVTEYEYDDGSLVAVDFGADRGDLAVDVLDDTAIVVASDEQFEFELPDEATEVAANNGVLTITE
ncbi:DUF7127 family protein [Halococcus saccharolyticus]|uniref:Hsp20/alpha crystallin family protein n=1 Tax=Halococcus saccharolyticus DSM 5350 TaxID=1227455 RepID=M0MR44_9EURY|nr:hypothetical protein C449_02080 [Halococcus saccharolyticus DSM 5350]